MVVKYRYCYIEYCCCSQRPTRIMCCWCSHTTPSELHPRCWGQSKRVIGTRLQDRTPNKKQKRWSSLGFLFQNGCVLYNDCRMYYSLFSFTVIAACLSYCSFSLPSGGVLCCTSWASQKTDNVSESSTAPPLLRVRT